MCIAVSAADGRVLLACEHQPRDQRRRFLPHRRDGVRVGIERDRDVGVPKAFGDDLGVDAGVTDDDGLSRTRYGIAIDAAGAASDRRPFPALFAEWCCLRQEGGLRRSPFRTSV